GTSIKVYLPLAEAPALPAQPVKKPRPPSDNQETILLVEDEDMVRSMTRTLLQQAGYTVLEGRNGADALQVSEKHQGPIDLLLTDVVMPKMTGRTLYQRLAQIRPKMKVLFMSGYTDSALFRHGLAEVPAAILLKPFTSEALLTHVREILEMKN